MNTAHMKRIYLKNPVDPSHLFATPTLHSHHADAENFPVAFPFTTI